MDRLPHHLQPSSQQEPHHVSLLCVGGMLRVAPSQFSGLPLSTPASSSASTPCIREKTHNVTPFKQLASPFTASAPFTAPTTPTVSTTPRTTTTIPSTPYSTLKTHTHSAPQPFYSLLSPVHSSTPPEQQQQHDLQPQPQTQLLTQKQVRELRRLCRKTANRAQFEGRLIQIRQVASIAAMASSTLYLFDPNNPTSGHPLRAWVEKHRAQGADWRDERPLSSDAISELRRWDLLLKAWARARFENHNNSDTRCNTATDRAHVSSVNTAEDALTPVRLEFEKISFNPSASPTTPANTQKPRNVYSTDFLRLASPVTPADGGVHNLASASTAGTPVHHKNGHVSSGTLGGSGVQEDGQARSAWNKPPLTGLTRWVDGRNPMGEVSINRMGDTINVTVPGYNRSGILQGGHNSNNTRCAAINDQENTIPADLRRGSTIHASTTAKSWRNALMQTPDAATTLFPGHDGAMASEGGIARSSPLDWGKFRRGDADQSSGQGVWQTGKND